MRNKLGQFIKGMISPNKGKKFVYKARPNAIGRKAWNMGKRLSKKHVEKIRIAHLGKVTWNKGTKGLMKPNSGSFTKNSTLGEKLEKKLVNHYWVKQVKIVEDGLEKKQKLRLNTCISIKSMDWLQNVIYVGIKKQFLMSGLILVELIKEICLIGDSFALVAIGNTTIQRIGRRSYGF